VQPNNATEHLDFQGILQYGFNMNAILNPPNESSGREESTKYGDVVDSSLSARFASHGASRSR
jgi:hypothetical protein